MFARWRKIKSAKTNRPAALNRPRDRSASSAGPGAGCTSTCAFPGSSTTSSPGLDAGAEINRVIGALFRKLTPERGPANKGSYPGEVCYFERLRNSPPETLTVLERLFVSLNAEHEELLEQVQAAGDDADRAEVDQAAADLADWVHTIQEELRSRRGKDTAQFEWEVTEP